MSIPIAQDAVNDLGYTLIHFTIAWMVLETFVVGLWYVATYLKPHHVVGVDDAVMPLALVFNIGFCILCILTVTESSVGHHLHWVLENRPAAVVTYRKQQVVYLMLYALACTFPKLAILGLYQRIFVTNRDRAISYTLMIILSLWAISAVICDLLQCIPLVYLWNPEGYPDGHCFNITEYTKWLSFPNILTDVAILLLPFPCIWKLQLPRRIKVGLAITFCTGSVGLITSIVRFATFFQLGAEREVDFPYISVKLTYVSIAESGLYLIATCLPNYRSLFRIVQWRFFKNDSTKTDIHSQRTPVKSIFLGNKNSKDFDGSHRFSRIDNNGTVETSGRTSSANKIIVESRFEMASFVESDRDLCSPAVGRRSWE